MSDHHYCPTCGVRFDKDSVPSQCPECETDINQESSIVTVMPMQMSASELGGTETRYLQSAEERAITVTDYPTVEIEVNVQLVNGSTMDRNDFQIIERGVEQNVQSVDIANPKLDIAVVFDDTRSMAGEITAMQNGVKDLTGAIADRGIDVRYALVSFKDNPQVDLEFTDDATELKGAVDDLKARGGGDVPEDSFGAIETALGLDRRHDATNVIIHITDAPAHYRKNSDTGKNIPVLSSLADKVTGDSDYTLEEVARDLMDEEVDFFAVAPDREDEQTSVKTLAVKAGGLWTDINAEEFDRILDRLTDLLTSTYTITYWTSLSSGETEEVEVLYEHPTLGTGRDTCRVSVPKDAG